MFITSHLDSCDPQIPGQDLDVDLLLLFHTLQCFMFKLVSTFTFGNILVQVPMSYFLLVSDVFIKHTISV